jgi:hypothetical protein
MSLNPVNNPLIVTLVVDVLQTFISDLRQGSRDVSINSDFWPRVMSFPMWLVICVFSFIAILKFAVFRIGNVNLLLSTNPLDHPLMVSIIIDVIQTLVVDFNENKVDLTVGGSTWIKFFTYPFWYIVIAFIVCSFLRKIFTSTLFGFFKLLLSYIWITPKKNDLNKNEHEMYVLSNMRNKKNTKSVRIDTSAKISVNSTGRDITSATPSTARSKYFNIV